MKLKHSKMLMAFSMLLAVLIAGGCGAGGEGGGSGASSSEQVEAGPTKSMDIEVTIPDDLSLSGVERVTVDVIQNGITLISGLELVLQNGDWVGNAAGLPIGAEVEFVAYAYNGAGSVVYQASSVGFVSDSVQAVSLNAQAQTTAVEFSIELPENLASARNLVAVSTPDEIVNVFANVQQGATPLITNQLLVKEPGSFEWTGTLANLPVGPSLTFSARGVNSVSANIYTGQTDLTLANTGNNVVISMAPENDGNTLGFVRITQILIPNVIQSGSTTNSVTVAVDGNSFEPIEQEFAPVTTGNFIVASTGSTLDFFGNATIAATYEAPNIAGSYFNTVSVTSLNRDTTIQWTFPTNVIQTEVDASARVLINPVITNLNVQLANSNNDLLFTASLFNLGESYDYNWVFNAATTGSINSVNAPQVTLPNYSPTVAGTLTLEVNVQGDTSRKTTLFYGIQADLFPDNVIQTF